MNKILIFAIALFCSFQIGNAEVIDCPFNTRCRCMKDSTATSFQLVICDWGNGEEILKFTPLTNGKYDITGRFSIRNFDIRTIPANHFAAFNKIETLQLQHQSKESPAKLNWNEKAFDGVQVVRLEISNLDQIVPVGAAIKNIANLASLDINSPSSISLDENSFKGIPKLNSIFITNTTVDKISENTFAGLENQITEFGFETQVSQKNIKELSPVLKKLTRLSFLHIIYSEVSDVELADFAGIPSNSELTISFLSTSVGSVTFTDNGLKFPKKTLIDFQMGGVNKMDAKVADLIKNNPGTVVSVNFAKLGDCEDFVWMSKLKCPQQANIDGAKCVNADGRQINLSQHLKFRDPETKCLPTSP